MSSRSNRAARLHAIAEELGVDPELVGVVGKGMKNDDTIRAAVKAHLADVKAREESEPQQPKAEKPKKAGLTLSQRRALLRLLDNDGEGFSPATAFKSLPFEKLVDVGYADRTVLDENGDDVTNDAGIGVYTLTDEGRERAETINPGYRDWSAGETVVVDEDGEGWVKDEDGNPVRPVHGTHRATKAEQDAIKAAAKAEAAKKAAEEKAAKEAAKEAEAKAKAEQDEVETKEVETATA